MGFMTNHVSRRRCRAGRSRESGPRSGPASLVLLGFAVCLATFALGISPAWAGEEKKFEVRIAARTVAEGGPALRASLGDRVVITWHSDEAGELHLHGYDIAIELSADAPTQTSFEAFAAGRFPFTSHGFGESASGHEALLYLEVYPD